MVLWLRADAGVLTTPVGGVYQWTDQSPLHNNFTQSTAANQPIYVSGGLIGNNGQPYLVFTIAGASALTSAAPVTTATSNWTMFSVQQCLNVTTVNDQNIFNTGVYNTNGFGMSITDTLGRTILASGVGGHAFGGTASTSWEMWANWDTSGVNTTCELNGVAQTSSGNIAPTAGGTSSCIGQTGGSGNGSFGGYISEIIVFARTLAAGELLSVNSYLRSKYGI